MWSAFSDNYTSRFQPNVRGGNYYTTKVDTYHFTGGTNDRSVVAAVINRIAVDVSQVNFAHILKDEDGRYKENCFSGLNECLSCSANIDQSSRDFMRDVVISMCDEGTIALVPTMADVDPRTNTVLTRSQ